MTKSQNDAYDEVVRKIFAADKKKRRDLISKGSGRSSADERASAYQTVRVAIEEKAKKDGGRVTAAEASVYFGVSPRTLSNARRRGAVSGITRRELQNWRLPGKKQPATGKKVYYRLSDLEAWKDKEAASKKPAATAASSSSQKLIMLDDGLRITTLQALLERVPWLVEDGKLISSLVITRLAVKEFSQRFATGAEVAWFSLHDAMTKWVWASNADRWAWAEGYRTILETAVRDSRLYDERTQKEDAKDQAKMLRERTSVKKQYVLPRLGEQG